ncbi:SUKH-3 domain-containing protein [Salmonella enterica]
MSCITNKQVMRVLSQNGWRYDRKENIDKYIKYLSIRGYFVNENICNFLAEFGDLIIKHESYSDPNEYDKSDFDPIKAADWLDLKWVTEVYEPLINKRLCPVGVGFSEHMTYFFSDDGALYGGFDDYFCIIGDNINEAMLHLFFEHEKIRTLSS